MSTVPAAVPRQHRHLGRSIIAVAAAILANVILSLATDQVLHVLDVYPPWGQPMYNASLNLLALGYRIVFGVAAGYLVARLAPRAPMRHAVVLGVIAVTLSTFAAIATITQYDLGPDWYPIALAITAFPCVWLGAVMHQRMSHAASTRS
jgi:uncharacterized membrane protein YfcA